MNQKCFPCVSKTDNLGCSQIISTTTFKGQQTKNGFQVFQKIKSKSEYLPTMITSNNVSSSRGKIHIKKFGANIWAKIGSKIRGFLPFSLVWFIGFSLNCIG